MLQWDPNDPYHAEELEKVVLLQLSKNLHLNADMFCQVSKKSRKKSMRERRLDKKVLVFLNFVILSVWIIMHFSV